MPGLRAVLTSISSRVSFQSIRLAVPPVAIVANPWSTADFVAAAMALDLIAHEFDLEFVGGFAANALNHPTATALVNSLPEVLYTTRRLCAFLNVGDSISGLLPGPVRQSVQVLRQLALCNDAKGADAMARFAVTANAVGGTPFMPMGHGQRDDGRRAISIGVGCTEYLVQRLESEPASVDLTHAGRVVTDLLAHLAQEANTLAIDIERSTNLTCDVIDLSVASVPTNPIASVGRLLRAMNTNLTEVGALTAISIINRAIRDAARGIPRMAGLSRVFISVTEDPAMRDATERHYLNLDKLLALTSVCSVGLDMVALGDSTSDSCLEALMSDQLAIGCAADKPVSVRLILVPDETKGMPFENALFGTATPLQINNPSSFNTGEGPLRLYCPLRLMN